MVQIVFSIFHNCPALYCSISYNILIAYETSFYFGFFIDY